MSRTSARHRKPAQSSSRHTSRPGRSAQHKKRSLVASVLRSRPAQIGVAATVGAAAIAVPAAHALIHLPSSGTGRVALYQPGGDLAVSQPLRDPVTAASPSPKASRSPHVTLTPSRPAATTSAAPPPTTPTTVPATTSPASSLVYRNPVRGIIGLIPERIDMGVDFGGNGPVYALGDAVITNATGNSAGWPGGGWITYQLTDGPAVGLEVYVAEDVQPTVSVGQHVTSSTVIANMVNQGDGIETGWAQPGGVSAESQLAVAGGISGGGPFPTVVGLNFDALLQALGAPAAPDAGQSGYGVLPSGYPTDWSAAVKP